MSPADEELEVLGPLPRFQYCEIGAAGAGLWQMSPADEELEVLGLLARFQYCEICAAGAI